MMPRPWVLDRIHFQWASLTLSRDSQQLAANISPCELLGNSSTQTVEEASRKMLQQPKVVADLITQPQFSSCFFLIPFLHVIYSSSQRLLSKINFQNKAWLSRGRQQTHIMSHCNRSLISTCLSTINYLSPKHPSVHIKSSTLCTNLLSLSN